MHPSRSERVKTFPARSQPRTPFDAAGPRPRSFAQRRAADLTASPTQRRFPLRRCACYAASLAGGRANTTRARQLGACGFRAAHRVCGFQGGHRVGAAAVPWLMTGTSRDANEHRSRPGRLRHDRHPATPRCGAAPALEAVWIARGSTFVAMQSPCAALPPLTMSGVRALAAVGQKIRPGSRAVAAHNAGRADVRTKASSLR
jgi:hypothetical protein